MWEHPEMTAAELGELLGRTPGAVNSQRKRHGRYGAPHAPVCCLCDSRPVWMESAKAKRYGLCKGCYLDEERMRVEDEAAKERLKMAKRRAKWRR